MRNDIERLVEILPPPESPKNDKGDWRVVEESLGSTLPADYKQFTEKYGSVKICNWLVIHTAFPWDEGFREFLLTLNQQYDQVVNGRDKIPFADFPVPGGLLPFGGTDNGDIISWITEGPPDEWGVFFWEFPGLNTLELKSLTFSEFLVECFNQHSAIAPNLVPWAFFCPEQRGLVVTT